MTVPVSVAVPVIVWGVAAGPLWSGTPAARNAPVWRSTVAVALPAGPEIERGDTLFAVAQASGEAVCRYPEWLYLGWKPPRRNDARQPVGPLGAKP